ncbi:MAG TPA: glycosyltransferase family 39 protein, partial [Candidatus Kryptonia bacterium]|nr:glycosyltransferase family 39 protein [Candidatus Kryptonia bacterium]
MSVGRLERVLYGSIGVVLFVIAAAMRRGHTIAVTSRIIVHVGGRSASVSVALALAIPMAVLVIALARTAAVRDALRALCRTPADVALIVAALALLLVTLIPAADSGRAMVVFLAYATTGFVLALWSLWPVVFGASEHWVAATIAVLREVPSGAFVIAVFLVVFLPANLISYGVFEHIPHVQDSISQLFQATLFAHGRAWLPTPPFGEFFDYTHVVMAPRWYSQFPPGHAAVLTLGVWLHAPWLINPLLGGATVVAVYHLGREVYGESVARVAAVLAALSPFIVFMSSEYMNHGSALLCVTLFMLGFARTLRTARWGWAALAGLGLGGVVCIRPLTGLALALPFVAYALYRAGREPQRLLLPFTLLALTSAVPLSGFLVYNQRTTGSPWTLGYEAKHGAGHGLGFGHSGWGPPHTPRRGVIHTLNNLNGMERYLFEWPIPSLLFVVVLVWSRRWRTWDALLLASWLSLVIAYFFYWYQDLCFGPRFQFEGAAALVLLTARGLQCLPHLLRTRCRMAVSRERVLHATGLIVGLCLVSMATVSLPPLMALYASSYWRVNGDVYRGVRRNQAHRALVFVDSNYGGAFLGNFRDSLDLNGDLVYARNLAGAGVLLAAYPGRRYYVA